MMPALSSFLIPPRPGRSVAPIAEPELVPAAAIGEFDPHREPWPGRTLTSGGVTLHVRETPGPPGAVPAVYVHGLAGSATNWTDLASLLAAEAPGTAVDLPGFGRSRPLDPIDYTPAGHSGALQRFLDGRGRSAGPVHLLGNSLGGTVAMDLAARRPDLVASLTLVSPAMPDLRPDPRRMSDPRLALAILPGVGARARASLARMSPRQRAEQVVRVCFGDPSVVPDHRLQEAADEIDRRNSVGWAAEAVDGSLRGLVRGWFGRGLRATAARIQTPTLIVWGDRDRLVSPRVAARTAASIPGAELLMLPGVGHVAQMEDPVSVARAVVALWRRRATRAERDVPARM